MSIVTSEQSVVDGVNKQLFIGGEWREASGGGTLTVEDPSTAEPLCEVADATPEDAMAALDAADGMQDEWGKTAPRERGEILTSRLREDRGAHRRARPPDDAGDGQGAGGVQGGGRLRRRVLPLVLGGGRPHRGPLRRPAHGHRAHAHHEAARGTLPLYHAVELPDGDGHPQDRTRDRRRVHDGDEAGPADAPVHAGSGLHPGGVGAAWRRVERGDELVFRRHDGTA